MDLFLLGIGAFGISAVGFMAGVMSANSKRPPPYTEPNIRLQLAPDEFVYAIEPLFTLREMEGAIRVGKLGQGEP